jgi:hypothetical protein
VLEHLLDFEPPVEAHPGATPLEKLTPTEHVNAQISTADWLKSMGAKEDSQVTAEAEQRQARDAFIALTTNVDPTAQHEALATLQTPPAVRHLTGMLSAYDWEFIQQAKQLRGYAVAKILEDCEHPTASIRLKALALLGKVTEVGLFTEKIEVKKTDLTEAEIDAKLKEKLAKFMDVSDAEIIDVEEKVQPAPAESSDAHDIDPENPDAE